MYNCFENKIYNYFNTQNKLTYQFTTTVNRTILDGVSWFWSPVHGIYGQFLALHLFDLVKICVAYNWQESMQMS